jgi:cyanate permease
VRAIDPYGWAVNIASGVVIAGSAAVVVVSVDRGWSWPLFVWGAAIGLVASAWAFFSTKAFGRTLMKRDPSAREAIEQRQRALWPKYRATYTGMVFVGVGVGILAAGLLAPAIDLGVTVAWVLFGLLPPLIAFPALRRRVAAKSSIDGTNGAD